MVPWIFGTISLVRTIWYIQFVTVTVWYKTISYGDNLWRRQYGTRTIWYNKSLASDILFYSNHALVLIYYIPLHCLKGQRLESSARPSFYLLHPSLLSKIVPNHVVPNFQCIKLSPYPISTVPNFLVPNCRRIQLDVPNCLYQIRCTRNSCHHFVIAL